MAASSHSETIQMRIPADPRYVSTVRRAVQSIARSLGFSEETVLEIEVSIAEALANAVEHGSPQQCRNAIIVVCKIGDARLTIDVRDEGPGFRAPECCDEETLSERGRGLRMIYQLMDKVKVSSSTRGSRISMIKRMHSTAVTPGAKTSL